MPRVGDVFQLLSGTLAVPNTTIQSAPYNAQQNDWVLEANTPRPISAGGTGSTTAAGARTSLGAIGAGDLAAAATKATPVGTDSVVIIDSEAANVNKRWLVSDFRASLAIMTDINPQFVSTDAGAGVGPTLFLDRISASPQDSDLGGTIQFRGKTSAATTIVYADVYLRMDDTSVDSSGGSPVSSTDGSLIFRTQRAGTLTTALTLASTLATVNGPLSVAGTITTTTGTIDSAATSMILTNGTGNFYLRPNASTTNQAILDAAGNWGLLGDCTLYGGYSASGARTGTTVGQGYVRTSTTTQFQFLHHTFYNSFGGVGSITTNGSATQFNTTSDETLKDFIGPYDPLAAIDIIRRDPVRDFTWKSNGTYAVGWGAQTSYAISPDLATPPAEPQAGDDAYIPWGIDQSKRTPYLWAALTWALDRIDDLHDRIKVLEEETPA